MDATAFLYVWLLTVLAFALDLFGVGHRARSASRFFYVTAFLLAVSISGRATVEALTK